MKMKEKFVAKNEGANKAFLCSLCREGNYQSR
jgi:hypothetical protein